MARFVAVGITIHWKTARAGEVSQENSPPVLLQAHVVPFRRTRARNPSEKSASAQQQRYVEAETVIGIGETMQLGVPV